jgi:4-hydroxy-tetrahydrodipicolinate synthase
MVDRPELTGIIGAGLTPFRADGSVDGDALERELEFMVGHCNAISILGVEISEYGLLSEHDRRAWLKHGVDVVGGRVPVLAGASGHLVGEVVELAEFAAAAGADYAQVLVPRRPWGQEPTGEELLAFFEAVANRSPLPIVVYLNPHAGADPPPRVLVELSRLDGVAAFKESSRDMGKIGRLIEEIDVAGNARYFTTMEPLLATLVQGGPGAMMPAPATMIGAEVLSAFRAGDLERAAAAQRRFAVFPTRWRAYGLTPVMKSALEHLGIGRAATLAPFAQFSAEDHHAIGEFLAEAGVLAAAVR